MARPPGILPSRCAGGLRGFPTARPCTGGKLARIPASHPADFPPPTRRAIGVPGKAARSQRTLGRSRCAAAKAGKLIASVLNTGTALEPVDDMHCPISIAIIDIATDASFYAKDAGKEPEPIFVPRYQCPAYCTTKNRVLPEKLAPSISVVMLL